MDDATLLAANNLKAAINFLTGIQTELGTPSTQKVVYLVQRPAADEPADLETALTTVEDFLVAQALVAIGDQLTSLQADYDALQPES